MMDKKDDTEEKYTVNVGEFYKEWTRCHSFQYQRDQLYRFGRADDCEKQWDDYIVAIKAKFTRDHKEARALIESTHLRQSQRPGLSTTIGVIWEASNPPSWD